MSALPSNSIPIHRHDSATPALYSALRKFWHPVAYASDVLDDPVGVTLLGEQIVLARLNGELRAMHSRCPHKGTNLALGRVVDGTIECPYHGWRFDGEGQCKRVPAREELNDAIRAALPTYHAVEQAGIVWVALEEPSMAAPEFAELNDRDYRVLQGRPYDWHTSSPRRLENFVDFAHFSFVHDGSIGSRDNPRVEPVKVWRENNVLRFDRSGIKEPGVGLKKQLLGITEEWIEPVNEYHVTMPHTVHLKRTFPNGKRYVLFMAACPIDEHTTRSFWWQARDFGTEPTWDKFFMDFEDEVLAQDKPIIESQRPLWFHLTGAPAGEREIPVRHADVVTIEYRKWLAEIVAAAAQ
ncbi:aromatic ring-hydroxylating dioxygenase subunit alpha [Variovorax dokdonensis]|uniref:Aromatic ring-hydroxylating dioxygenase subunit alpha n=1 Tax=Variovorax dokdonensis TaxID=344883 RepID=A0ABT7NE89_9BURK|nr:aromatic ring-hydroxylating dioxygenase subunit alpha [Variovorax dokdonensis]MDM0046180.1 aromatic ring-hydroxylating dioxygenase subunit alpha [Variovorax dokdonensis]